MILMHCVVSYLGQSIDRNSNESDFGIMKKLFAAASIFLVSTTTIAAPDEEVVKAMVRRTDISAEEIRANYNACDSGVTWSMKICGSYHWMVEDVRLNKIYKRALVKAKEAGYEKSLIQAQRAWLTYLETDCAYEGEMGAGGGSAEGLYVLGCKQGLTKQRADHLEEQLTEQ